MSLGSACEVSWVCRGRLEGEWEEGLEAEERKDCRMDAQGIEKVL